MPKVQPILWALGIAFFTSSELFTLGAITSSDYDTSHSFSPDYKVYWKISNSELRLGVEASVTGQAGWAGFGIAEMGGMKGADIVYYESSTNSLTDAWADGSAKPKEDECQDWTLVSGGVEGSKVYFEATRKLDTTDTQDWPIVSDSPPPKIPHRVIGAWGSDSSISFHGENRVLGTLRFYGDSSIVDPFEAVKADSSLLRADIHAGNYNLRARRTIYYNTCADFAAKFVRDPATPVHVVGVEVILSQATAANVHHIVLKGCNQCDVDGQDSFCTDGGTIVWAWAPGSHNIAFPAEAGLRLLGPSSAGGFSMLDIEIHYDNPTLSSTLIDDTVLRFYYTETLRAHDVGVFNLGDPTVALANVDGSSLKPGWTHTSFTCTSGFTNQFAVDEVTVVARGLHMHEIGARMSVKIVRDGTVYREDTVEMWDFNAAGVHNPMSINVGYKIKKGDAFELNCWFYNPYTFDVEFGQASNEEMCMDFILYYPRQELESVGAEFGVDPHQCILWRELAYSFDNALFEAFYEVNKHLNYGYYNGTEYPSLDDTSDTVAIRNAIGRSFGVPCNAPPIPDQDGSGDGDSASAAAGIWRAPILLALSLAVSSLRAQVAS